MLNKKNINHTLFISTLLFFVIIRNVAGQTLPNSQEEQNVVIKLGHNIIGSPTYLIKLDSKVVMIDTTTVKYLDKNWISDVVVKGKEYENLSKQYPDKHLVLINIKRRYREQVYNWLSKQNELVK